MTDPYLAAFIQAAEAGESCPQIRVVTAGGELIIGEPVAGHVFVERMHGTFAIVVDRWLRGRPRHERKADPQDARELAANALGPISGVSPAGDDTLTLADATVIWGGRADGMQLPAIRVALGGITAWWVTGGKEVKAPASYGFGVGAIFPAGN